MTREREVTGRKPSRRALAAALALVALASITSTATLQAAPRNERLEDAEARLRELERDFELVVEEYNLVNEELTEIQADMAATELVVRKLERKMSVRRNAAVGLAQELYKSGGSSTAIESVLSSDSIAELETRVQYLRDSEDAQSEVFERLAVDQAELQRHLRKLDQDRAKATAAKERLDGLREQIEGKVADQKDEISELNAAIERARRRRERRRRAALEAARAAAATSVPSSSIPARPAPAPNPSAQRAVDAALSQIGKPYQWAAAGPDSYDCSGLTMWAWAQAGVSLPHNSGMQYSVTPRVSRSDWAPGDLLFFGSPIHHVGMYIGNGQMVEAPYTGAFVRVNSAYRSDYVGAGRPGV